MRRFWQFLAIALVALAPTVVQAQAGTLTLTWTDNASNETGQRVERATGTGSPITCGTFTLIASLAANVTTFQDTGLTEGAAFCYRVDAFNTAGTSAFSNVASAVVPFTIPAAPTGLSIR